MSASGHSRHFANLSMTSGLPLEADIVTAGRHVSKVPIPDIAGDAPKGKGGRPLIWIIASRDPAD
jgi:hypothetical protein